MIVLTSLPAWATDIQLADEDLAYIKANPVIRVSNELDWPPFNYNERGRPKGYSIEYINIVAAKLGLKVEFVSGPSWDEFLDMIRTDELDVILNIVETPERSNYVDFTGSYLISIPSIFVRSGSQRFSQLTELAGKTVAVPKGFFTHELLKSNYPAIKLHLTRDWQGALEAVIHGQADAAIGDLGVSEFIIKEANLTGIEASSKVGDPKFTSIMNLGVLKGNVRLKDILQKGMDAVSAEEETQLRSKWLALTRQHSVEAPLVMTRKEKAFLAERGEITACIDPDWLPYEKFDATGNHIGMSADYFDAFSQRLAKPIRVIKTKSWPESLEKAQARECDILSLAMPTPDRRKYLNFSVPYVKSPIVIATRPSESFIPNIPSIGDNVVGLVKGYAYVDVFRREYPDINVIEVKNLAEGLELVRNAKIFGMIDALNTVGYAIQNSYVGELKISGKFEDELSMGVGVRNDKPELLSIFNKAIERIAPEQHRAIVNSWVAVQYEEVTDYKLIIEIVVIFIFIALFLVYRQVQLRNEAKKEAILGEKLRYEIETKDRFFSIIAHDLRSPFNSLLGMTQMMSQMADSFSKDQLVENAKLVNESGEQVFELLENLLEWSRLQMEGKKIEPMTIPLHDLSHKCINILNPVATEKSITLTNSIMKDTAYADTDMIQTVIRNLVSNSLKFTPSGGRIEISSNTKDGMVQVSVSDTGVGISKEQADNIFSLDQTTATVGTAGEKGTGLGLPLCKEMIEINGGKIWLESTQGEGSHFHFTLPVKPDEK